MRYVMLAAVLAATSSVWTSAVAAQNLRYGWCEAAARDGTRFLSGVLQTDHPENAYPVMNPFLAFVKASHDPNASLPSCSFFYHSAKEALSNFKERQTDSATKRFVLTGWEGGFGAQPGTNAKPAPAQTETASKPAPSGAYLTVEKNTGLRDAGKTWDAQVKKTLQEEAQRRVETAAKAAAADAQRQAEIEAFFRERRKQGVAQ